MKRIVPLLLLLCALSSAGIAATLSGTVYYITTSTPVPNQVVVIADTMNTWNTTATTDAAGHYSVTIPATVPTTSPGNQINVSTMACGQYQRLIKINTGSPVADFYICTSSSASYTLQGTVSLGGVANTGRALIYLIKKAYDPAVMDTTLTVVDTFVTAATGGTYSKTYTSIPAGTYLLKAALLSTHPAYSSYLPTYYTSALNWTGATTLGVANFTSNPTNITMIAGTNPGGPGFIGGSVILGANKSTAVGDPLGGRLLLLTTSTGQAVAYTLSDAAGKFQFPNLAYGSYKVFGDALGKSNPQLSVTISATAASVGSIIFSENNKKFEGRLSGVGVNGIPGLEIISVFPNPATTAVFINGLDAISGSKTVVLSSITGAVISRQVIMQGNATIATAALPAGVYMLQVQTEAGTASYRVIR